MAYLDLSTKQVGDPITADDWDLIKSNFTDHETRIAVSDVPIVTIINESMFLNTLDPDLEGKAYYTALQNVTITSCYIQLFTKGTSTGAIEIDLLKSSTLGGVYTSIFSTKPSLTLASVSDYDKSTNQVFNSGNIVTAGEIVRLDLTQVPATSVLTKFLIVCYGELT